jgi:phage tail sheath protein FI
LCLGIANAIDRATRWAVFEQPDARLAEHVRGQVYAYLYGLANLGAIEDIGIAVHCDAGMSKRVKDDRPGVTILITIQPSGCDMPISLTLQQTVAGYRVANTAFAPIMDDCA